ncbi:RluA family pseudouridine synthase [Limibacter armeniacum]|uniref:RluA family pseudouridine synthase n=1 Tax=Limibacter armeniacum TaxID=466084 RepID=UPI002FE69892
MDGDMQDGEEVKFDEMRIDVDMGQALLRIDKFLVNRIPNLSRNRIQDGIRDGDVLVNGFPVKPNYKVRAGDVVMVIMPQQRGDTEVVPQNIPLNVVYEDDDLLVVNKEPGMVVHPGFNNWDGTLVNALVYHFGQLPTAFNADDKPGLVHRIDKDTSGLLVVAKTEQAMNHLARQFYDHSIERTYYALVWGEPDEEQGTVKNFIGRSFSDRRVSTVHEEGNYGKFAVTHYKVLKRLRYVSLVQCNLETGRTHQIRVHMKYLGHPLFGDVMYGGNRILKGVNTGKYKQFVENCFSILPRQGLHAKSLGFVHPRTGKWMQFDTELPEDLTTVLEKWDNYLQYN